MATTRICVGMDSTNPNLNLCTTPFSDGGFIPVNLTGQYVFLYREGGGSGITYGNRFTLAEVDIYGMMNIAG